MKTCWFDLALRAGYPEVRLINNYYGDRKALRSGRKLIEHIREGCEVLCMLDTGPLSKLAFCLHPLVQVDRALLEFFRDPGHSWGVVDPKALILAMEYRARANAWLSHMPKPDYPKSPLVEVNQMLIADKVQNLRDFLHFHKASHPRSAELEAYFLAWLRELGVHGTGLERYLDLLQTEFPHGD